jgi:aspartyl-tRNA(Asn)/glutamyl-tRNA(Gln) amidotransferase subunit C
MSFTEQDLDNLSKLARIDITPEEKPKMLADMQAILGYISEINEVEGSLTRGEETVFNVVREDVVTRATGLNTEAILANAPSVQDGYVKVEQVLK